MAIETPAGRLSSPHSPASPLRLPLRVVTRYAIPAWFYAWAAFFAWTTICAVVNFSWRQPMSDEFVNYQTFLGMPFPANVLQSGNGHRPIFPNLVIAAETQWFGANHLLQFALGLACAVATALVTALAAWREKLLSPAARAACVMLGVLGVLCLANGRMLLHSYESLHVYLLTLSVALAGIATFEAWQRQQRRWLIAACAACTVAMFCFGSGVASFPAVIVLAFVLRLPPRWFAIPVAVLAICLFLYLFALPGDQGVRNVLAFHPIDSALVAADWLASPWTRLWFGHASPPLDDSFTQGMPYQRFGSEVVASANWLQGASGLSWRMLSRVMGIAGIVGFLIVLLRFAFAHNKNPTRLKTLATMFCLFALATATVISLSRLDYFRANPEQVWADRYIVWPSLFWSGLAILVILEMQGTRRRILGSLGGAALLVLPLGVLPTQQVYAVWGSIVYRSAQQMAALTRSGLYDPSLFPNGDDASPADVQRSLDLFRHQYKAMFADARFELVGTIWANPVMPATGVSTQAKIYNVFDDPLTHMHAGHFEGHIDAGYVNLAADSQLAVLDADNRIVGLAEFSHILAEHALLKTMPRKQGFDGYIRDFSPDAHYRLVALSQAAEPARVLCDIQPLPPAP